jgi:O-methyltransferase involved in polyketide biosynthesis
MVAAGRARATNAARPLIDDPFAEPLVRAVGIDFFTRWATGESDVAVRHRGLRDRSSGRALVQGRNAGGDERRTHG